MIPPRERREQPTTAERRAEWEARVLAKTVLMAAAGLEKQGVGSLAVLWDTVSILLALLRKEAANRGVKWEAVEHALNEDAREWEGRLGER